MNRNFEDKYTKHSHLHSTALSLLTLDMYSNILPIAIKLLFNFFMFQCILFKWLSLFHVSWFYFFTARWPFSQWILWPTCLQQTCYGENIRYALPCRCDIQMSPRPSRKQMASGCSEGPVLEWRTVLMSKTFPFGNPGLRLRARPLCWDFVYRKSVAGRILLIFSRLVDSNQHEVFFLLHLSVSGPKHLTGAHLVAETGWRLVLSSP